MTDIILFATYWNEIDWIRPSLAQIDRIDPVEVIICDGCFDMKYPVPSTDGTREVIQEFVSNRKNTRMISPVRCDSLEGAYELWRGHAHSSLLRRLYPARIRRAGMSFGKHHYRVNQALTFNRMISLSQFWEEGGWFMTYDCDQFYQDRTIENIQNEVNGDSDAELLTADERTFFHGFKRYTDQYEARKYNNMPHRIRPDTMVFPTRAITVEGLFRTRYYVDVVNTKHVGTYHHYKFDFEDRFEKTYEVGDRERPDLNTYKKKEYCGEHPGIIQKVKKRELSKQ
jgi:hypothetical protein